MMGQRSAAKVRCPLGIAPVKLSPTLVQNSLTLLNAMTIKVSQMNINKRRRAAGTGALSYYFLEPNEPRHRVLQPDQQLLFKLFIHSHTISPMFAKKTTHDTGCALQNKKLNVQTKNQPQ